MCVCVCVCVCVCMQLSGKVVERSVTLTFCLPLCLIHTFNLFLDVFVSGMVVFHFDTD